jgi:hypothetical protein
MGQLGPMNKSTVGWITPSDVAKHQAYMRDLAARIDAGVAKCFATDEPVKADWRKQLAQINAYLAQSPSWLYAPMQLQVGRVRQAECDQYWIPKLKGAGCDPQAPLPPVATPGIPLPPLPPGLVSLLPGSITELVLVAGALWWLQRRR